MMEIWREIPGYDGLYLASNTGKIKSFSRYKEGKELSGDKLNKKGYKRVNIKNKAYLLHRLIALTFIPNPYNKEQINHIDSNKLNNSIENLEWVSNQENRDHAVKNNLIAKGETQGQSKLFEKDILQIFKLKEDGLSQSKIAKIFNVKQQAIYKILNRQRWKHVKV